MCPLPGPKQKSERNQYESHRQIMVMSIPEEVSMIPGIIGEGRVRAFSMSGSLPMQRPLFDESQNFETPFQFFLSVLLRPLFHNNEHSITLFS